MFIQLLSLCFAVVQREPGLCGCGASRDVPAELRGPGDRRISGAVLRQVGLALHADLPRPRQEHHGLVHVQNIHQRVSGDNSFYWRVWERWFFLQYIYFSSTAESRRSMPSPRVRYLAYPTNRHGSATVVLTFYTCSELCLTPQSSYRLVLCTLALWFTPAIFVTRFEHCLTPQFLNRLGVDTFMNGIQSFFCPSHW